MSERIEYYTRIINKTEDYIEEHLSEKITLYEVANNVGLSSYHFHRIFKEFSNETLNDFIIRIKLERSAVFIKVDKDISLTEIAYRYGFGDSSSYSRAFSKHFGMSPTKFRQQQDMSSAFEYSVE